MTDMATADLLLELGCEELPPRAVDALREALFSAVCDGLEKAGIGFDRDHSRSFSTPRRLAMILGTVEAGQANQVVERRGPSVDAAFDADGKPTPAAQGFARSVGLEVSALERVETEKGAWLFCRQEVPGRALGAIVYEVLETALRQLPIPRPMRWSDHDFTFVRPVHWLVVLYGDAVLQGELLGCAAGRDTRGHRVHDPGPHRLANPGEYPETLRGASVIADPDERRGLIERRARAADASVIIDAALLDEVNNLVEWPLAVVGSFDEEFLKVPHAALIASMQDHQKFFPVAGALGPGETGGAITNRFVAISNVDSSDFDQVRAGYERVIRPRLADARFFLEQDEKKPLADFAPLLDDVVFQEKIGTIGDKTRRIVEISKKIADVLGVDPAACARAASLCKCDLMTQMVGEFPELQGEMGAHYARASGEPDEVATAIAEHYAPRFAGDVIPASTTGRVVGLADRADTLAACFAAGLEPSGNKDPFALRRAALGLVRILAEAGLNIAPSALLAWATQALPSRLDAEDQLVQRVEEFVRQRARGHYREQGFSTELVSAAIASPWTDLPDLEARLGALAEFMGRQEAESLAAANKRIGNILRKSGEDAGRSPDESLLQLDEERRLFAEVRTLSDQIEPLLAQSEYSAALAALATLRAPVDAFFDTVLVMDEDPALRRNRLALLAELKSLFDGIADLSVLG